jgi:hypothetical protein
MVNYIVYTASEKCNTIVTPYYYCMQSVFKSITDTFIDTSVEMYYIPEVDRLIGMAD